MNADDPNLVLIDLCHEYGASQAARAVTDLAYDLEDDLLWLMRVTGSRYPGELLIRHFTDSGHLNLQYSLDAIAKVPELGIRARKAVTNWFLFYGILELAIRSSAVSQRFPKELSEAIRNDLSVATDDFWSKLDLPLVSEIQRRVSGRGVRLMETGEVARRFFDRFLSLNSSIRTDPYLTFLTDLLNDSLSDDKTILQDILASPITFCKRFTNLPNEVSETDKRLLGICRSFLFIRELHELLEESRDDYPYLSNSIRTYSRYWTDLFSTSMGIELTELLLNSFERWADDSNDSDSKAEILALRNCVSQYQLVYA